MRTKVTLVLLFLNVALFFFIFKFERNWRIERASLETRRRVLGAEAADIRQLAVTAATPGHSYRLERRHDSWWLAEPLEWPANPPAVNRLINELLFLEHVTSFAVADLAQNGQSLADYGLEKPKMKVTFRSGANPQNPATTILIGDTTKVGSQLYVLSADGTRVHVVGRGLADSLGMPLEQLRADSLLTIPVFEARSVKLQPAAPAGVAVYIRRDGNRWLFGTPLTARASKDALELVINELDSLRVKAFVAAAPGVPMPSAAPTLRITLEGNNRLESLLVGAAVPAPAGAPAGAPDYYAQFEDRSNLRAALFTVAIPAPLMEKLRDAQERLRETHILDFDSRAVSSVSLAAPNQPALVLQRLEPSATAPLAGTPDSWQMIQRGDSSPANAPLPADHVAVDRLLQQLTFLEAKKFLTESASANDLENWGFNRPEREITLTQSGPASSTVILQIGVSSQRDGPAYARLGPSTNPGASIYLVDRGILQESRPAPYLWRERTLRELPTSARITEVRLAELGDKPHVLVEVKIDPAGQPDKSVRHPAAVTALLGELRVLRAKQFLPEAFGDRVATLLGEKPWHYQLDATVALPGGAAGEQVLTTSLLLTERVGGAEQFAGSREFNATFAIQQPMLDALWTLVRESTEPAPATLPDTAPPFHPQGPAPAAGEPAGPASPGPAGAPTPAAAPLPGNVPTAAPAAPTPPPSPAAGAAPGPTPGDAAALPTPAPTDAR